MRHCFCLLLAVCSISVFAAESGVLALKPYSPKNTELYNPQGLWPLLGIGAGVMDSNGSSRTGGVPTHVKVLGSYYFTKAPMVADVGLGLQSELLTQNGSGPDTIQSLYTELAGRYVLTNRWQLGAIWNTLVDNQRHYESKNDNLASFVGLQALKEFAWDDDHLVRMGGRAMTSVGLNGGSVNTIMAELEVSFGSESKVGNAGQFAAKPAEAAKNVNDSVSH